MKKFELQNKSSTCSGSSSKEKEDDNVKESEKTCLTSKNNENSGNTESPGTSKNQENTENSKIQEKIDQIPTKFSESFQNSSNLQESEVVENRTLTSLQVSTKDPIPRKIVKKYINIASPLREGIPKIKISLSEIYRVKRLKRERRKSKKLTLSALRGVSKRRKEKLSQNQGIFEKNVGKKVGDSVNFKQQKESENSQNPGSLQNQENKTISPLRIKLSTKLTNSSDNTKISKHSTENPGSSENSETPQNSGISKKVESSKSPGIKTISPLKIKLSSKSTTSVLNSEKSLKKIENQEIAQNPETSKKSEIKTISPLRIKLPRKSKSSSRDPENPKNSTEKQKNSKNLENSESSNSSTTLEKLKKKFNIQDCWILLEKVDQKTPMNEFDDLLTEIDVKSPRRRESCVFSEHEDSFAVISTVKIEENEKTKTVKTPKKRKKRKALLTFPSKRDNRQKKAKTVEGAKRGRGRPKLKELMEIYDKGKTTKESNPGIYQFIYQINDEPHCSKSLQKDKESAENELLDALKKSITPSVQISNETSSTSKSDNSEFIAPKTCSLKSDALNNDKTSTLKSNTSVKSSCSYDVSSQLCNSNVGQKSSTTNSTAHESSTLQAEVDKSKVLKPSSPISIAIPSSSSTATSNNPPNLLTLKANAIKSNHFLKVRKITLKSSATNPTVSTFHYIPPLDPSSTSKTQMTKTSTSLNSEALKSITSESKTSKSCTSSVITNSTTESLNSKPCTSKSVASASTAFNTQKSTTIQSPEDKIPCETRSIAIPNHIIQEIQLKIRSPEHSNNSDLEIVEPLSKKPKIDLNTLKSKYFGKQVILRIRSPQSINQMGPEDLVLIQNRDGFKTYSKKSLISTPNDRSESELESSSSGLRQQESSVSSSVQEISLSGAVQQGSSSSFRPIEQISLTSGAVQQDSSSTKSVQKTDLLFKKPFSIPTRSPNAESKTDIFQLTQVAPETSTNNSVQPMTTIPNQALLSSSYSVKKSPRTLRPWLSEIQHSKNEKHCETMLNSEYCLAALFKCMASECDYYSSDFKYFIAHLKVHWNFRRGDFDNFSQCPYCKFKVAESDTSYIEYVNHIQNTHEASKLVIFKV